MVRPLDVELPEAEARRVDLIWSGAVVFALALLFFLLLLTSGVAVPVLLALAGAYVLNPVVSFLERRGVARVFGTAMVFVGMICLLVGAAFYLVPVLTNEAGKLPDFVQKASGHLIPWLEKMGVPLPRLVHERALELSKEASGLLKSVGPTAAKLLAVFAGNTAKVLVSLLSLLVVPVLGFFFLKDFPVLVERAKGLLPRRSAALVTRRFEQVDEVLSAFVRGQLTVGAILSVIYCTGFSLARIDLAIVVGLITGFGNMVPYVGTGIGITLALLAVMLSWHGAWQLAFVAGTVVVAQSLEATVITPQVVGEKVGLPAVMVIIAVLAFGELFGFVGVLLAVPSAAILKVVLEVVIERYRHSPLYTGERSG